MIIHDRIYGKLLIDNPLFIDLINSKPVQRLQGISQDGAPHFIQPIRDVHRFEHSIGTWYLSAKYQRPVEEQIASLLHDIPHTAFSHVIDYVVRDENQEYHDHFTKQLIQNSEIPEICAKYGVNIEKVLAKENFYLLDNDLPDVSVDRWDYFMRDGYMFGVVSKETITLFLEAIKVKEERFYFEDSRVAAQFAILFMNCSRLIWLDPTSHGSFFLIAEAIRIALKEKIMTEQDFFKNDAAVWEMLRQSGNAQINAYLDRLKPGKDFSYAMKEEAEFYGPAKPRCVDPWVLIDGELKKVSDIVPGLKDYIAEYKLKYKMLGVKQN